MPQITKLEVQKKNQNRVNVYVDDVFFSGINLELCIRNGLKVGNEISTEKLERMIVDDELSKAISSSSNYLSKRLKTQKETEEYLKKKDFSECVIEKCIEQLKTYKYIDDDHYAKAFVLTYGKKYGKLKLSIALQSKGIDKNIIEDNLCDYKEDSKQLLEIADKYLRNKEINRDTLAKLSRFLYSRGYDFDSISNVINEIQRR